MLSVVRRKFKERLKIAIRDFKKPQQKLNETEQLHCQKNLNRQWTLFENFIISKEQQQDVLRTLFSLKEKQLQLKQAIPSQKGIRFVYAY